MVVAKINPLVEVVCHAILMRRTRKIYIRRSVNVFSDLVCDKLSILV